VPPVPAEFARPFPKPFPKASIEQELQNTGKRKPAVSSGFSVERAGIEPATSGLQSQLCRSGD
jgi:hypothetical protein